MALRTREASDERAIKGGIMSMLNLGKRSICQSCKKPIYYNGKNWDHVEGRPRHLAVPLDTDRLELEIVELEHELGAKKHLLRLLKDKE